MTLFVDYFECDECGSRDFTRIYNFSLRFHNVNFSDDLIYDKRTSEIYQCTGCNKRFTAEEIENGLIEIRQMRKRQRTGSS